MYVLPTSDKGRARLHSRQEDTVESYARQCEKTIEAHAELLRRKHLAELRALYQKIEEWGQVQTRTARS